MSSNWTSWYRSKGYKVEPEIPFINKRLNAGSRILDIGCGHGRHVIYFSGNGHDVFGIDNHPPIIKHLDRQLARIKLHADLKCYDFTKGLPYPNGYFDLVIATRSIHHTNARTLKRIFGDINRVIKIKGFLFLQVPDYEGSQKLEKTWVEYGKPITHRWIEKHTYIPLSGPEKGVLHRSLDRKELMRFLRGYKIIRLHTGKKHYHGYCVIARKMQIV